MNRNIFAVKPLIYLITDGTMTTTNFERKKENTIRLIKIAVRTKVSLIQIREKQLPAKLICELAAEVSAITRRSDTKLLINDRADIALAVNADGVHLTAKSLSASIIRKVFPENFIVGVSAHSFAEAALAAEQSADFTTFSPIYSSPGKSAAQGLEKLKAVCERLNRFSVLALGGVDESNIDDILQAGASGFAAIRFLNDENNLRNLAGKFRGK